MDSTCQIDACLFREPSIYTYLSLLLNTICMDASLYRAEAYEFDLNRFLRYTFLYIGTRCLEVEARDSRDVGCEFDSHGGEV